MYGLLAINSNCFVHGWVRLWFFWPLLFCSLQLPISGSEYVDVALFQANLTTIHQYYKHRAACFATCSCFTDGFQFVTNVVLRWSDHAVFLMLRWVSMYSSCSHYHHDDNVVYLQIRDIIHTVYDRDNHTWIYCIPFILVYCAPLCLLVDTFDQLKPTRSVVSKKLLVQFVALWYIYKILKIMYYTITIISRRLYHWKISI